ncbi:Protein LAZY 1 [Bienertia sinuspersici]
MKLLTWMHRKFRQGNGETLKEFSLGQPMVDDSHLYQNQKQNQGRQRRSSFTSVETTKYSELEQKVSSATTDEFPEYFDGFLAIGTLGNETVISEPETPTFAVSFEKLAEGEAEVTKNELRLINDELERVLAVEAKDDGWTDSSGRNSHVSNGRISHASSTITLSGKPLEIPETTGNNNNNLMNCPLQEYLLGSAVELPVAEKASVPKKENRTSLGELFERHKAEENPETKYKRAEKREDKEGDKTAASMNLMKKILTKKKNALHAPSRNSSASFCRNFTRKCIQNA